MQVVPLILVDVITIDFNGATHRVMRAGCGSLLNQASLSTMNGANSSFLMQCPPFSGNGSLEQKQLYTPNSVTLFYVSTAPTGLKWTISLSSSEAADRTPWHLQLHSMVLLLISQISNEWNICVALELYFCKDCLFSDIYCVFEKDSTNQTNLQSASWAQE